MFQTSARTCARIVGLCALIATTGCPSVDPAGEPVWPEQVLSSSPTPPTAIAAPNTPAQADITTPPPTATPSLATSTRHTEAEPNNDWVQAEPVAFGGSVQLTGTMTAGANVKDIDMFQLGPVPAGGRVLADINVSGGTDVQIGLFDGFGRLLAYVDPISPTAGPDHIDMILHEPADPLWVMVAARSSSTATRAYTADIQVEPSAASLESSLLAMPTVNPQVVVLVFHGADQVRIGSRLPVNVPSFDIAAVNSQFAGRTSEAIDLILQKVREDYQGLAVEFYQDADPALPAGDHTAVYFGTSDTRLLGLADNIDPFNRNPIQSAIIYTDTFSLFNQLNPGFEGTVQVLANVASHETGHLLGLRHTADPQALMDVTATARQMLMDQWFKTSPLHGSVLPLGVQDAPTMLSWSLGGALEMPATSKLYARARAIPPGEPEQDFYIPRSLLADCGCIECDHLAEAPRAD